MLFRMAGLGKRKPGNQPLSSDFTDLGDAGPAGPWFAGVAAGTSPAHNVPMRDASGHPLPGDNRGLWPQVQLSRGRWRREDAAGAISSAGWWESVTVTWSPAPAPGRRPAIVPRVVSAAADVIAPVLAGIAVTSTRRLWQRRDHRRLVASLLRQPLPAGRELPRSGRIP